MTEGTVVPTASGRVYNAVRCCHIAQHENCTVRADHTVWATETSKPSEMVNGGDTKLQKKKFNSGLLSLPVPSASLSSIVLPCSSPPPAFGFHGLRSK